MVDSFGQAICLMALLNTPFSKLLIEIMYEQDALPNALGGLAIRKRSLGKVQSMRGIFTPLAHMQTN
jgi:hypothetical protein